MDQLEAIAKKYHDDTCDAHNYTSWESMLKAVTEAYELGRTAMPKGWKLVPIEPTKEMIVAGQDEHDNCIDSGYDSDADGNSHQYTNISPDAPSRIYRVMLEASPLPQPERE